MRADRRPQPLLAGHDDRPRAGAMIRRPANSADGLRHGIADPQRMTARQLQKAAGRCPPNSAPDASIQIWLALPISLKMVAKRTIMITAITAPITSATTPQVFTVCEAR